MLSMLIPLILFCTTVDANLINANSTKANANYIDANSTTANALLMLNSSDANANLILLKPHQLYCNSKTTTISYF